MKKLSFVFTLLVLLSMMSRAQPAEIRILFNSDHAPDLAALQVMVDIFNGSQNGYQVRVETFPNTDYHDFISVLNLAQNMPCMVYFDSPYLSNYVASGYLRPLTPYLAPSGAPDLVDDLLPTVREANTVNDELYAVSTYESGLGLWANRAMLAAAGVRIPDGWADAWTFEEFNAALDALSTPEHYALDLNVYYGVNEWYSYGLLPFLWGFGGGLVDTVNPEQASGILNSEASLNAMTWLQSRMQRGDIANDIFNPTLFINRRAALSWAGHWEYNRFKMALGDDLVLLPLPDLGAGGAIGAGEAGTPMTAGAWTWGITESCPSPDGAAAFLNFMLRPENITAMTQANGGLPSRVSLLASDSRVMSGSHRIFAEALLSEPAARLRPKHPAYPMMSDVWIRAFEDIRQYTDVQTVLERAALQIDGSPVRQIVPFNGEVLLRDNTVTLHWQRVRPLTESEVYEVTIRPSGGGLPFTTRTPDPYFTLTPWAQAQTYGEFTWSVRVVGAGYATAASPERTFTFHTRPIPAPSLVEVDDGVRVAAGFQLTKYNIEPTHPAPTQLTFGPDGYLYMTMFNGNILRFRDEDGDNFAEFSDRFYLNEGNLLKNPVGIAFFNGQMYISDTGRISRFYDTDGNFMPDTLETIIKGLSPEVLPVHSNNGITFGPDGRLYVAIGSHTDHGPRTRDPFESTILSMNPDGTDVEVFARGFRNPYDLSFSPSGQLFTADNSPNFIDESLYSLPAEELNHVRRGLDYGFPYVYGGSARDAGDSSYTPPVTELYSSGASSGLTYYSAAAFPPEYRDGVFVTLWGTSASDPLTRGVSSGRSLLYVWLEPITGTSTTGSPETTYIGKPVTVLQFDIDTQLRPVDVTVGPDGALYIAEYRTGDVYRLEYTGSTQPAEIVGELPETGAASDDAGIAAPEDTGQAALGAQLFASGKDGAPACTTCHLPPGQDNGLGPSLYGLADEAGARVSGLSARDYIYQSIVNPMIYVASGYGGYMYPEYAAAFTPEEVNALVDYVMTLSRP